MARFEPAVKANGGFSNVPDDILRLQDHVCTLSTHDEGLSTEDVLVNLDCFPPGSLKISDLLVIKPIEARVAVQDFQIDSELSESNGQSGTGHISGLNGRSAGQSNQSLPGKRLSTLQSNCFVFSLQELTIAQKQRQSKLEISVASHIAQTFSLKNRSQVTVSLVDKLVYAASHVEISFRDQYLTRSDMWRLTVSELCDKTVYKGQRILFMGTIKAVIKNIYVQGQKLMSAYFGDDTVPVFRSESARYVLFIQMSKEMWDFDSDGSGEIMFDKVINGFLPDLFKRWTILGVKHLVSIVLFTRVEYDLDAPIILTPELGFHGVDAHGKVTGHRPPYKDFYRVVVNEMASGQWTTILYQLKKEFLLFHKDVSTQTIRLRERPKLDTALSLIQEDADAWVPRITGGPSAAIHGNILEAIVLASSNFANDFIDRDLVRTGISIVIITPGTALFEVDRDVLRLTTDIVISNGIGLDIVCLSKMPLHSVPLFHYHDAEDRASADESTTQLDAATINRNASCRLSPTVILEGSSSLDRKFDTPTGSKWVYAVPNWIDVSFWSPMEAPHTTAQIDTMTLQSEQRKKAGVMRCKMYELQMGGVPENENGTISIPYLHENYLHPSLDALFKARQEKLRFERAQNSLSFHSSSELQNDQKLGYSLLLGLGRLDVHTTRPNKDVNHWMELYDDGVFQTFRRQKSREMATLKKRKEADREKRQSRTKLSDPFLLGTSFSVRDRSPAADTGPGSAYFDRKMKDRLSQSYVSARRDSSASSIASLPYSSVKSTAKARNFSLNLKGFSLTPPKATSLTNTETVNGLFRSKSKPPTIASSSLQPNISNLTSEDALHVQSESDAEHVTGQNAVDLNNDRTAPIKIKSGPEKFKVIKPVQSRMTTTSIFEGPNREQLESEKLDALQAASRSKHAGPKIELSSYSHASSPVPTPQTAVAPWLTFVNPFNMRKLNKDQATQFRRWQHIYPKPLKTSSMKWKSLCSPAAIPLTTEYFPSSQDLANEYTESPYTVSTNDDVDDVNELVKSGDGLLRELISLRLSQGFQLVVGQNVKTSLRHACHSLVTGLNDARISSDDAVIVMSMGNHIHQISRIDGGDIEVKRMTRKLPESPFSSRQNLEQNPQYRPTIRTTLAHSYDLRKMNYQIGRPAYNWNFADALMAGYGDDFDESLRFWRARYVFIPCKPLPGIRRTASTTIDDDDEEIQIEGIRRLTQNWLRHKYIPAEERQFRRPRLQMKDANPLDITYQTCDPSVVIAAELAGSSVLNVDGIARRSHLFTESEPFQRDNYNLTQLAQEVQSTSGVKLQDRRWHFRTYDNSFIGYEFTTWLLNNFKGVNTREEAVDLGNELMERRLFEHVVGRHKFRDGNYYYRLSTDYVLTRPESRGGWFSALRSEKSIPPTPIIDKSKETASSPATSSSLQQTLSGSKSEAEQIEPTSATSKRRDFVLSRILKYDVDNRKKSSRSEIVHLHYDLLHNPDSCYHIRIDWMSTTSKLIEDAVLSWATTAEKYGLKLVQVPIAEARTIQDSNPFKAPYRISLAFKLPPQQSVQLSDPVVQGSRHDPDYEYFYHRQILKRHDFILDMEASNAFPSEANIKYSWGRPDNLYPQFIHSTGLVLAQIVDDGNFLLLANPKFNTRITRDVGRHDRQDLDRRHVAVGLQATTHGQANQIGAPDRQSPFSSPSLRATPAIHNANFATSITTEEIFQSFENFCRSEKALQTFFESLRHPLSITHGELETEPDQTIPTLGLPQSLGRDGSLANQINTIKSPSLSSGRDSEEHNQDNTPT